MLFEKILQKDKKNFEKERICFTKLFLKQIAKIYRNLTFVKIGKNVPVSTPVQTLLGLLTNSGVESGAVAMSKITKQCSAA